MLNGTDTEARRAARKEAGNLTSPLLLFLLLLRFLARVVIVANGTQSALAMEARRADMEAEHGMDTEARRAAVKCVKKFASNYAPHHLQNVANGTVVEAKRAARRAAGTIGVGTIGVGVAPLGWTIIILGVAARKEARRAVVLASEAVPNACLSAILPL